jgi:hypothetical protein
MGHFEWAIFVLNDSAVDGGWRRIETQAGFGELFNDVHEWYHLAN